MAIFTCFEIANGQPVGPKTGFYVHRLRVLIEN